MDHLQALDWRPFTCDVNFAQLNSFLPASTAKRTGMAKKAVIWRKNRFFRNKKKLKLTWSSSSQSRFEIWYSDFSLFNNSSQNKERKKKNNNNAMTDFTIWPFFFPKKKKNNSIQSICNWTLHYNFPNFCPNPTYSFIFWSDLKCKHIYEFVMIWHGKIVILGI